MLQAERRRGFELVRWEGRRGLGFCIIEQESGKILNCMAESQRSEFDPREALEVARSDIGASLPPRKRLLAGLKKQIGWLSSSSSSSSASTVVNSPTLGLENCDSKPSLSPEDIVEASKAAAAAAAEAAVAAKAIAAEKAAVAVKAAAAAKSALELAAFAAREEAGVRVLCSKTKPTKHVPIKLLYKGKRIETRGVEERPGAGSTPPAIGRKRNPAKGEPIKLSFKGKRIETKGLKEDSSKAPVSINDEELARELHRAINSSPRISRSMGHLDAWHLGKQMNSDSRRPSSHPPRLPKQRSRPRLASSEEIKVSDADRVSKELGLCTYSRAVTGDASDWPLEVEDGDSDKFVDAVSEEGGDFRVAEDKLDASEMEEEASCSLQPADPGMGQQAVDTRDSISENKAGPKRKKTPLDDPENEECQVRSSKCSRTQAQAGDYQDNRLAQEMKGSPLTDDSTLRSRLRRSNMKHNSDRRTKSISGDFPQESEISVEATSNWHRDKLKPLQQATPSVPLQTPVFAGRSARRHS